MIGASKILTVSYGTFSCTLEGFDDPFNTMKAIAEYFRDLAAEDRYFGAEPPTPDAAMLHRIAERQVQRRVEARVDDRGVTLRAAGPESAGAAPAATVMALVPPAAVAAPVLADAADMPDGVAARLARIRAAVAEAEVAAATRYVEDEAAPAPSDLAALFAEPAEAAVEDAPDMDALAAVLIAEAPAADTDAAAPAAAETLADAAVQDDTAPQDDIAPQPTVAADIPAFPEEEPVAEAEDPLFFDEIGDDAAETPTAATLAEAFPDEEFMAAEPAAEAPAPWAHGTGDRRADDFGDDAPEAPRDDALAAAAGLAAAPGTVAEDAAALADKAQRARARIIRIRRAAMATAAEPPAAPGLPEENDTAPAEAAPTLSDAIGKALARAEAAQDSDPTAEAGVTPGPADAPMAEDAALASALSSILAEADLAPATPDSAAGMPAAEAASPDTDAARAPAPAPVEETAVSRLMEQTRTEMAVPENRRRLSAIAHLKAAVAATVAERLRFGRAKAGASEDDRSEAYRDDLARVVRPLRPEPPAARDDAEGAEKAAPLVLVSSQRIDRAAPPAAPQPPAVAPVRPRRIVGAAAAAMLEDEEGPVENIFSDTRSFAEFAENVGAHALPDLIEAAAAYAAAVEGRDQFTRPQLMRQVETATGELQREDGLRSFGALLRDGRIVKVTRGRFAVTESSRFLAEARKLAG